MKTRTIIGICLFVSASFTLNAQVKIGDNPGTIDPNSLLEMESTNKGFLPPRVAINSVSSASPLTAPVSAGMLVYSSGGIVPDGFYYWDGTKWRPILSDNIPSYGELYENGSSTLTVTTAGTYYQWINATLGITKGAGYVVGSVATDNLTIGASGGGIYRVDANSSLKSNDGRCNKMVLFKNGIAQENLFCRQTTPSGIIIPSESVNLVGGTLISGTISDIETADGINYIVQEGNSGSGYDIQFTFTDLEKQANVLLFNGYNLGSNGHEVELQVYNITTSAWDNILASTKDIPNTTSDIFREFTIQGNLANYYNASNQMIVRIYQTGSGSSTHYMYIDKFLLTADEGTVNVKISGLLSLAPGDVVDLRLTCNIVGTVYNMLYTNLNIFRIDK
ncbi:MAG: hypothetical protein A2275_04715 [Bacteroidetes bacterium RIFOXYA12_FULL_35_11]|nr:MAG: hypothetical protein A2X01_13925 [Bacteroidetes bacterium GWF2_35_48]OFY73979.1 MAG: hypothetical protein A2275_04715 [Bacteroidetes bacterium RIFOXYA12_FULL_35_11]OFZ03309.1 MAG: hypothetical protein A2491_18310 [Bacteroidetes bacterium RIFOXYC12_FULL_35_7]HBX52099.1 hypothetical protein [Bacteroidales bacterium]